MDIALFITVLSFAITIITMVIAFTRQYTKLELRLEMLAREFENYKVDSEKNRIEIREIIKELKSVMITNHEHVTETISELKTQVAVLKEITKQ